MTMDAPGTEHTEVLVDRASRDAEFTDFVRRSSAALTGTAWLLCGDVGRAEDLVQHALLRTYLAWPRVRGGDPLAYARRVVANARIDAWRRVRRERLTDPVELPEPAAADGDHAAEHAERDRLARALATLTARQRRVVVLRHLVGLPEAAVAADLGISVGTVKSTASRALRRLEALLEEMDTPASPREATSTEGRA